MGAGDRISDTTDFFLTHGTQCAYLASKLRGVADAAQLVAELNKSAAACDAAIARGSSRKEAESVTTDLPAILQKYGALAPKTQQDLETAVKADAPPPPK